MRTIFQESHDISFLEKARGSAQSHLTTNSLEA